MKEALEITGSQFKFRLLGKEKFFVFGDPRGITIGGKLSPFLGFLDRCLERSAALSFNSIRVV